MERRSVAEFLDNFLARGNDPAYVQRIGLRSVRTSYLQVAQDAFRFARALQARGIGKGERVMLWGANSAAWVAAFFGCALRDVVVVPIDDAAAVDFALRVSQQVQARLLVGSRAHVTSANDGWPKALLLDQLRDQLAEYSCDPFPTEDVSPQDTLQIVFTSGTTAEPKGVVISHGNVLGNMAPLENEIRKYLKYEKWVHPVRFLNLLPLSHVFGQFLGMFLPQLMGGVVVFQDTLKPGDVMSTIRRERVSVLVAVPRMLQSLKEKIERDAEGNGGLAKFQARLRTAERKHFVQRWWMFRDIHGQLGWKFWAFISGGAALDSDTEEFWGRLGYAAIQGYGLTETTSLISVNHPFRLGKGSIGKVLAGKEVKLASDGEIMVRGTGVATGYWSGQELKPVTEAIDGEAGWYRTGDVGELDATGNLYFKGRKKDVIVTPAGMNVYPDDLEAALRRQPEVKDCAVIALPRGGNAEACAVLLLRDGQRDAEQAVKRANQSLAEYQRMRDWYVWPELDFPRTSTQKPKKSAIQQAVVKQRVVSSALPSPAFSGAEESGAPTRLTELLRRVTGRSGESLDSSTQLEAELNLSSLDRVELLSALEDRYQIDLNEAGFSAVQTVGDLQRVLQGNLPGAPDHPPAPSHSRARFHYPAWVQRWPVTWVRLAVHYLLLRPAIFLLGWPRVSGREKLRGVQGPLLVVCNHIGGADVGFVLTALPAHLRNHLATAAGGEALESLRTPGEGRGWIRRAYDQLKWTLGVSLLNLFPLPREAGFRQSFAYAAESVERGYSVLIFPEGRHTKNGDMWPFRSGIGLLASSLRIPVLPMRIDGLFELQQAGRKFAWPYTVQVRIGEPVTFPAESEPEWIAQDLQRRVAAL